MFLFKELIATLCWRNSEYRKKVANLEVEVEVVVLSSTNLGKIYLMIDS